MATPKVKKKLLAAMIASAVMSATSLPGLVWAQSSDANLRGKAAANADVAAKNVATGAVRRTKSGADGSFTLTGLSPGTYEVNDGGATRTITLTVASTGTIDLTEGVPSSSQAQQLEGIVVTSQVLREVKTSEVGDTISLRQIQTLPQATRNFLEFADTVPGMAFTIDQQGHAKLQGGATNVNASNLYIDGIGQKNYVSPGGIAGQGSSQGNPFPQLAIGEYKVITSNYKAEYGQIGGAAVTAATRSGSNEFEGESFFRYTDQNWRSRRPDEPTGEKTKSHTKEYGLAVGGPLIKDELHFFFAYEGKENAIPRTVVPAAEATGFLQYLPADIRSQFGPVNLPFSEDLYFAKLDWELSDRDRLELSGQYRDETQRDAVGGQDALSHGKNIINKDKRATLRWQHSADSWFNEVIATTEDTANNPFPVNVGNGFSYIYNNTVGPNDVRSYTLINTGPANGFNAADKHQKGWSLQDDLTFNSFTWHGDHTFKSGISYKAIDLTAADAQDLNPQFSYGVTENGIDSVPFRVDFLAPYSTPGQRPVVKTNAKQYGLYLQDDWAVNDKLLLNLGIRWDYEANPAYTNFVTSAAYVAALYSDDPDNPGHPWADRLHRSGIDASDFISDGHSRSNYKDAWAPRFGFSYDFNGDEAHVLHGGAGRSYDRNLFEQLAWETSKAALSPVSIYFRNPATGSCYRDDGRPCIDWDPAYLNGSDALHSIPLTTGTGELFVLDNHIKTPYSDQFSLGITNRFGEWITDATIARIVSKDGLAASLINRYPDGSYFQNGGAPWGNPVPGYANTIYVYNGIQTRNTQLLLSAEKPYTKDSGWGMTIAYTFNHARQNRDINETFAFDGATIFDYPFIDSNAVAKHRLVVAGSIDGPLGFTYGGKIVLETPKPQNGVACYGQINADGSGCNIVSASTPGSGGFLWSGDDIFGYRTVDLQATKDIDFGSGLKGTVRLNVLNVFDFKNYSNVITDWGSGGVPNPRPVRLNTNGDILYVPRTVSIEVGLKFK